MTPSNYEQAYLLIQYHCNFEIVNHLQIFLKFKDSQVSYCETIELREWSIETTELNRPYQPVAVQRVTHGMTNKSLNYLLLLLVVCWGNNM